ncbi:unnamed protein product, partial [Laminaria digitata]
NGVGGKRGGSIDQHGGNTRYRGEEEGGRRSCDGEDYRDGDCRSSTNASLVDGAAERLRGCTSSRCCWKHGILSFAQAGLVRNYYCWVVYRYWYSCIFRECGLFLGQCHFDTTIYERFL